MTLSTLLAAVLVALVISLCMPLPAAAASRRGLAGAGYPRRALAGANYVDTCYHKSHARVERWAIDYMCADVTAGATETWMIEVSASDACEQDGGQVTVTIGANGEPVATNSKGVVCESESHRVAIDSNLCDMYKKREPVICYGYIDDRVKSAKSYNIFTVHEVPEPKYSATVRYQVRLKANCQSLEDQAFKGFFGTAGVFLGEPCTGAAYEGDATYGNDEAPADPWMPASKPKPGVGPD